MNLLKPKKEPLFSFIPSERYFIPQEFVDPETYEYYQNNKLNIWSLFDPRLLYSLENLRIEANVPFVINNWNKYKKTDWEKPEVRKWSGFRPINAPYSKYSQHRLGRALDILPQKISASELRRIIIDDPFNEKWKYITCLEITLNGKEISWCHMDTRNHNKEKEGIKLLNE